MATRHVTTGWRHDPEYRGMMLPRENILLRWLRRRRAGVPGVLRPRSLARVCVFWAATAACLAPFTPAPLHAADPLAGLQKRCSNWNNLNKKRKLTATYDEYMAWLRDLERRNPGKNWKQIVTGLHREHQTGDEGVKTSIGQTFLNGPENAGWQDIDVGCYAVSPSGKKQPYTPYYVFDRQCRRIDITHVYAGIRSDLNRPDKDSWHADLMRQMNTDLGDWAQHILEKDMWWGTSIPLLVNWKFWRIGVYAPGDQLAGNSIGKSARDRLAAANNSVTSRLSGVLEQAFSDHDRFSRMVSEIARLNAGGPLAPGLGTSPPPGRNAGLPPAYGVLPKNWPARNEGLPDADTAGGDMPAEPVCYPQPETTIASADPTTPPPPGPAPGTGGSSSGGGAGTEQLPPVRPATPPPVAPPPVVPPLVTQPPLIPPHVTPPPVVPPRTPDVTGTPPGGGTAGGAAGPCPPVSGWHLPAGARCVGPGGAAVPPTSVATAPGAEPGATPGASQPPSSTPSPGCGPAPTCPAKCRPVAWKCINNEWIGGHCVCDKSVFGQ